MSKSPSLRRIQADIRELALDPSDRYHAAPLESDMFEWHFTIRGADGTDFEGGVYHGRIMLPPEYPFKPPHIILLTPSGRFETNTKVCLSFSAYHPELWQPAWGIRLILEALISFLPTPADGAIGALDWTSAERKKLAKKSVDFHCPTCGCKAVELLPPLKPKSEADNSKPTSKFQKEIEKLQQMQHIQHGEKKDGEEKENGNKEKSNEGGEGKKEPALMDESNKEQSTGGDEKAENPSIAASDPAANGNTSTGTPAPQPETPKPTPAAQPAVTEVEARDATQQEPLRPTAPPQREDITEPLVLPPPPIVEQDADQQLQEDYAELSWLLDPVLHGMIIVLAIICFLLMRKVRAMMEELEALNEVLDG